ncbi:MAG: ferredoxin [Actinobacteria bacterium]|nr:MAG: ferredoxin [Actinomycetota bacterium]
MKTVRNIIRIDETLCDGCGNCVTPCAEGAIEIVGGKAKVISENLCDGAGMCISSCPTGALKLEQREADEFDAEAVIEMQQSRPSIHPLTGGASCLSCGSTDDTAVLFPCRSQGENAWVCARCLPQLIHG